MKRTYKSQARYHLRDYFGTIVAVTSVTWRRSYGKANLQTHGRTNTYHTPAELKAWGKRNNVEIDPDDLELLRLECEKK